jgi:hypothetical protein
VPDECEVELVTRHWPLRAARARGQNPDAASKFFQTTVPVSDKKAFFIKIHYFHVLTGPLHLKFQVDFKNDLKKFHTTSEGHKIFD